MIMNATSSSALTSYYNYLRAGNWTKKRPDLPDNVDQLLQDWVTTNKVSQVFITSSVYLHGLLMKQRHRNMTGGGGGVKRSLESPPPLVPVSTASSGGKSYVDTTRVSLIPDLVMSNESSIMKMSVMLFCLNNNVKDTVKCELLLALLQDKIQFDNVQTMLNDFTDKFVDLRDTLDTIKSQLQFEPDTIRSIIRILVKISDLLRDKSYAKLAMTIDGDVYAKHLLNQTYGRPIQQQQQQQTPQQRRFGGGGTIISSNSGSSSGSYLKNVAPYDPLFSRYVSLCIAPKDQNETRVKLYKQFSVNRYDIVADIINELPPFVQLAQLVAPTASDLSSSALSKKSANTKHDTGVQFDETADTVYHVYESKINFMKLLGYTESVYNGKKYMLLTYNDCIFDVIGENLFGKTWQERLDEIPGPAKIRLDTRTGVELNNYKAHSNCTLGVSWLDKAGRIMFKAYTPKRSGDLSSPTTAAAATSLTNSSSTTATATTTPIVNGVSSCSRLTASNAATTTAPVTFDNGSCGGDDQTDIDDDEHQQQQQHYQQLQQQQQKKRAKISLD